MVMSQGLVDAICKDPISWVERMGEVIAKGRLMKCSTVDQGKSVALLMMTDNLTLLEVKQRYHIMDDTIEMRADYMRQRLRELGGDYRWINNGDDGQKAVIEVSFRGKTEQCSYSIDDARKEGLVKPKSRWEKAPGDMLRARATTKAVRMHATEVIAGFCTDEEMDAVREGTAVAEAAVNDNSNENGNGHSPAPGADVPAGESREDGTAMVASVDGPISTTLIAEIKQLLADTQDPELVERVKAKLAEAGKPNLAALTQADGEVLKHAIAMRNMETFFTRSLEEYATPTESADAAKN